MPIQPMNLSGYQQVPDVEDVTPISSAAINAQARKNSKTMRVIKVIGIAMASILFISSIGYYLFAYEPARSVYIYETSSEEHRVTMGGMKLVDIASMQKVLPSLDKLEFGNINCDGSMNADKRCSPQFGKIIVDSSVEYQKIVGFGGAFTEASAINYYKLRKDLRKKFMDMYFGPDGIKLTMGRIHINSCDFSNKSYSFDDVENDFDLNFFDNDVTHDNLEIIPFIREAMELSEYEIKLVASPWSPPAWMKNPQNGVKKMTGSATPQGLSNDPRIKLAWARYLSKFISAYKRKGVDIWAMTPQNEPEFPAPWEACSYNASFESQFINQYLGPIIRADHPSLKILGFDHNKDHLEEWTKVLVGNDAGKFIDGMAFHCKCTIP